MNSWQVQKAKARFSELMEKAHAEGPQVITRHGSDHVVVLSIDDFRSLGKKPRSWVDVLLNGPVINDLDAYLVRTLDPEREIDWDE